MLFKSNFLLICIIYIDLIFDDNFIYNPASKSTCPNKIFYSINTFYFFKRYYYTKI